MTREELNKAFEDQFSKAFEDHLNRMASEPLLTEKIKLVEDTTPVNKEEKAKNLLEILRLNYTDDELVDAFLRIREIVLLDLQKQLDETHEKITQIELAIQKLS